MVNDFRVGFLISPPEAQSALWHRRHQGEGCRGWEPRCICGTSEHLVLELASELVLDLFQLFLVSVLESVLLLVLAMVLVLMAEVLVACCNQENCKGRHTPEEKYIILICSQRLNCSYLSYPSADAVFTTDFAFAFRLRHSFGMLDAAIVEATPCESRLRFRPIHCDIEKGLKLEKKTKIDPPVNCWTKQ